MEVGAPFPYVLLLILTHGSILMPSIFPPDLEHTILKQLKFWNWESFKGCVREFLEAKRLKIKWRCGAWFLWQMHIQTCNRKGQAEIVTKWILLLWTPNLAHYPWFAFTQSTFLFIRMSLCRFIKHFANRNHITLHNLVLLTLLITRYGQLIELHFHP